MRCLQKTSAVTQPVTPLALDRAATCVENSWRLLVVTVQLEAARSHICPTTRGRTETDFLKNHKPRKSLLRSRRRQRAHAHLRPRPAQVSFYGGGGLTPPARFRPILRHNLLRLEICPVPTSSTELALCSRRGNRRGVAILLYQSEQLGTGRRIIELSERAVLKGRAEWTTSEALVVSEKLFDPKPCQVAPKFEEAKNLGA